METEISWYNLKGLKWTFTQAQTEKGETFVIMPFFYIWAFLSAWISESPNSAFVAKSIKTLLQIQAATSANLWKLGQKGLDNKKSWKQGQVGFS